MLGKRKRIRNLQDLTRYFEESKALIENGKRLYITIEDADDRTLAQNALLHKWIREIADQMGETTSSVKDLIKLRYGIPILCENEEEMEAWEIESRGATYEEMIFIVGRKAVTSKLSIEQMSRLIKEVEVEFRMAGYALTDPELAGLNLGVLK